MSDSNIPESQSAAEPEESFEDILFRYEQNHSRRADEGTKQLEGTVVAVTDESVFLDIGFKSEGILPLTALHSTGESVKVGDRLAVSVKGRDPDGYYELSLFKVERPMDWSSLEQAFAEKTTILGTVTGVVKGGFSVDVGVRAFMPSSRSGVRDDTEAQKLVGQEIRCRITKLDVADEDVVVDRRTVAEEEERSAKQRLYSEIKEGETVQGEVRSLTDYGAFVDLGGVDGLLHVNDLAWGRTNKPADVLSVGQQIEAKILKIDREKRRISLGLKQLQPHPWDSVAQKYKTGDRVRGAVTRIVDFGAFVELEPGIEGLIHVSEMSWAKKVRTPGDLVKPGEVVEVVILGVNVVEHRMSLGLKQALGDPWANVAQWFAVGSVVEGVITSLTKFGAFVQLAEGVEGMIHVSEISAEKRITHPQEVLKIGQRIKAQVLAIDAQKRVVRLGTKQLIPSSLDEYMADHKEGDVITGRMIEVLEGQAHVQLGEGIRGTCRIVTEGPAKTQTQVESELDLSALSTMLEERWKSGPTAESKPEAVRVGQVRSFRIVKLDLAAKRIELELV